MLPKTRHDFKDGTQHMLSKLLSLAAIELSICSKQAQRSGEFVKTHFG